MEENRQQEKREPRTYELKRYLPTKCIQKYSYMLIRPPRFTYNLDIISPKRKYKNRFEHAVYNIPFPLSVYTPPHTRYIILYLHGNSSSRYQGYSQLSNLPAEVGLACFDFAGCGNRTEQEYISLGKRQAKDVDIAVRFLKERNFKVALWGRSMGAVSALLSTQCDVIVTDSPFSSLQTVAKEISKTQVPCWLVCFFHCLFPCFFYAVSKDVEQKTGIRAQDLNVIDHINDNSKHKKILFLAASGDKMIHCSHSQLLHQKFEGLNKKLIIFEGTHNSDRPYDVLNQAYLFIQESLLNQINNNPPFKISIDKTEKREDSDGCQIASFSALKEQKAEKLSSEMRVSVKIEISSKLVEGGLTQNLEVINQNDTNRI